VKDDLSLSELAAFFDVSQNAAARIAREGLFVRARRGRYDLAKSAKKYTSHLREIARNTSGSESAQATIALKQSAAKLNDLKRARLSDELVPMAEAKQLLTAFSRSWRAAFLSLPARVRVALKLSVAIEEKMETVVDQCLSELVEEIDTLTPKTPRIRLTVNAAKSGPKQGNGWLENHDEH
jgi:phage terminase Nu1 subunit (DNA packaging protein)